MSIVRNPLAFATRVDITYYYVQLINGVFDAHTCVSLCFKFMAARCGKFTGMDCLLGLFNAGMIVMRYSSITTTQP